MQTEVDIQQRFLKTLFFASFLVTLLLGVLAPTQAFAVVNTYCNEGTVPWQWWQHDTVAGTYTFLRNGDGYCVQNSVTRNANVGMTSSCSADGTSATISWNSMQYSTLYRLYVDAQPTGFSSWAPTGCAALGPGDQCIDRVPPSTSATFASVPGERYVPWMQMVDEEGNWLSGSAGINGGFWCLVPQANPSPMCGGNIRMTWPASGGASSYEVSMDGGAWINVGNVTSYDFNGLAPASIHSFRMRVWVGPSLSAPSQAVNGSASNNCGNIQPTANAGADQYITQPTNTSNQVGAGENDADGWIVSRTWTKVGGPAAGITNPNSLLNPQFTGMNSVGTYTFRLTVTDNLGGTASDDMQVIVSAAAGNNPVGTVDIANCTQIAGWTCDADSFATSLTVNIYDGATLIASPVANIYRADIEASPVCGGTGLHGFNFATPASLKTGTDHTINVHGVNVGGGANAALSGSPTVPPINCPVPVVTNLTSDLDPLTASGPLTQGTNVTFNGRVRNTGTSVINTGFSDNFTSCWGAACSPASVISSAAKTTPFAVNGTQNDTSASFNLANTGTLRVQHCIDSSGQIAESDETVADNCTITDFTVNAAAATPDLIPQVVTQPAASVVAGGNINMVTNARNQGGASTGVGFSNNITYQWGGTGGVWRNFNPAQNFAKVALAAGGTATNDSHTFSTTTTGTLYLQYCVDSTGVIAETGGEGNNCYVTAGTVVTPAGGFSNISACDVGGANCVATGGTKTINVGDNVEIQWSSGGGIQSCSVRAGGPQGFIIPASPADLSGTDNTITEPAAGGSTIFTVRCRDASLNNYDASVTVSTAVPNPDLIPIVTSAPAASVVAGGNISITANARNQGTAATGVGFRTEIKYQWGGTGGIWRDFNPAYSSLKPALAAGGNAAADGPYTFSTTTIGTIYIQYCVDSAPAAVNEGAAGEANNCYQSPGTTVTAAAIPDLIPIVTTAPAASVVAGGNISFVGNTRNQGTAATAVAYRNDIMYQWGGTAGVWRDFNPAVGPINWNAVAVGGNAPNDSYTFSTTTIGTIYLRYRVDRSNAVAEGVAGEANNTYVSAGTTVTAPVLSASISACDLGGANCVPTGGTKNIVTGNNIEIQWSSVSATSCSVLAGGPAGLVITAPGLSGTDNSITEPAGGASQVFTVRCTNGFNNFDASVTVTNTSAAFACTGADPANSLLCAGDSAGLVADVAKTTVNACTVPVKCEFLCDAGYVKSGNNCVPASIITFEVCDLGNTNCVGFGNTKTVSAGAALEVHWNASDADFCQKLSPGVTNFSTGNAPSGNDLTVNANALPGISEAFTIACGNNGVASDSKTVTVDTNALGPDILTADKIVKSGSSANISWDTNNTATGGETTCTLSGGGLSVAAAAAILANGSGTPETGTAAITINSRSTFTLTCPGIGTDTVTIDIVPTGYED